MSFLIVTLALLLCSCSKTSENQGESKALAETPVISDSEMAVHQLPLPVVPDSLTRPSQRADYMILHFWDALDLNNKTQISDRLLIEQTFSNFIEILPYASSPEAIQKGVDRLFDLLSPSVSAYNTIADMAQKYLYDPESPFVNPSLYRFFLNTITSQSVLPVGQLSHFKAQADSLQLK